MLLIKNVADDPDFSVRMEYINDMKNNDLPKFKAGIDQLEDLLNLLSKKSTYIDQNSKDAFAYINELKKAYTNMVNAADQLSQVFELLKSNPSQAKSANDNFIFYYRNASDVLGNVSLKCKDEFWDFWSIANDLTSK